MSKKKKRDPTIDRVRASHHRQNEQLEGIRMELDQLMADYAEAYDAGLTALRSGMGKFGRGSTGSDVTRTTEAASYEFKRMKGACAYAGQLLMDTEEDLRRAELRLERAGAAILNAWLDTDPDIRRERRAIRQAAIQEQTTMPAIEQAVATATMQEEGLTVRVVGDVASGAEIASKMRGELLGGAGP